MAPDLLFVNKSSSSDFLTRSTAHERIRIFGHVQAKRRKAEARNGIQPWAKYASVLPDWKHSNSSSAKIAANGRAIQDGKKSRGRLSIFCPTHNASDPFHCTVAGDDVGTHAILQFAFSSAAKTTFLAEAFAPAAVIVRRTSMRHDSAIRERLRRCINDSALMYATLAYGSSCYGWMCGIIEHRRPPEYFISIALPALRSRLAGPHCPTDTWLLLAMYSLAITEMWSGIPSMWSKCPERQALLGGNAELSRAACRTHLEALLQSVETAGGWHMFDSYVLESSILADKFLALYEMNNPIIAPTWDPGVMPTKMREDLGVCGNTLPNLGRALLQRKMAPELREALQHIISYTQVAFEVWSFPEMTVQIESWLFLRFQALNYRLLLLKDEHLSEWDDCIRIAALGFLQKATDYHGACISAGIIAKHLRSKLTENWSRKYETDTDLRFWCLCMGAMMTESSLEQDWFAAMILEISYEEPVTLSKETLEKKLEPYLYVPLKQSGHLSVLTKYLHVRHESFAASSIKRQDRPSETILH